MDARVLVADNTDNGDISCCVHRYRTSYLHFVEKIGLVIFIDTSIVRPSTVLVKGRQQSNTLFCTPSNKPHAFVSNGSMNSGLSIHEKRLLYTNNYLEPSLIEDKADVAVCRDISI